MVVFTPGARPTEAMASRLLPVLGERLLPNVMAGLERGPESLHQVTEGLLAEEGRTARLMLVIDQFEEVFTRASQNEAAHFLDLIQYAVNIEDGRTLVVLTMRADFFDRLSAYPDIAALFEQENMVIATDMTPENLRRSVEGPAEAVGLVYDHGLTDRILDEVRQQL
jgi:archaellum biogenesis ATPase FlaH